MRIARFASNLAVAAFLISSCESLSKEKIQGAYFFSVEDESFIPCRSNNAFWITGSDEALENIRQRINAIKSNGANSESPIFVEIIATNRGKANDGFAMDYESVYEVHKARIISNNVPIDCAPITHAEGDM